MNRLMFRGGEWTALRDDLIAPAPLESAAALIVGGGRFEGGMRLIVREIIRPAPDDYIARSPIEVSLTPMFLSRVLKRARLERAGVILAHSHPVQRRLAFSSVDDAAQQLLAPVLHFRCPQGPHGFLIAGPTGFRGRLFDIKGETTFTIDRIQEIGRSVRSYPTETDAEDPAPLPEVFDRNVRAFGAAGQRILNDLTVAVVGVGGTGSVVVEELARLGVGRLHLIDPEQVERTNLNRLMGAEQKDVDRPKVAVASEASQRAKRDIEVMTLPESVIDEPVARTLLDGDFVMCCTDSHGSRAVLNQIAYQYRLPMIDVGVRIDAREGVVAAMSTRVQMLAESLACLNCHSLLDPAAVRRDLLADSRSDPYFVGHFEPQPAVISLNAATSSMAVSMFLSAVTGFPGEARHLIGRPIEGSVRPVSSRSDPTCVVCAQDNALAKGDSWPMIWRQHES
ncbi:ThiF family adenylyltransferase [Mesorhizobium sp. M1005]|uniref:HesA/MoeB/ThiF family protein n=1 Tax=unclassified Mesorhizobium TaxID=325217 RepID=UPI003339E9D7